MKMYIRNQIYFYLYTRWRHDLVVTFADIESGHMMALYHSNRFRDSHVCLIPLIHNRDYMNGNIENQNCCYPNKLSSHDLILPKLDMREYHMLVEHLTIHLRFRTFIVLKIPLKISTNQKTAIIRVIQKVDNE